MHGSAIPLEKDPDRNISPEEDQTSVIPLEEGHDSVITLSKDQETIVETCLWL